MEETAAPRAPFVARGVRPKSYPSESPSASQIPSQGWSRGYGFTVTRPWGQRVRSWGISIRSSSPGTSANAPSPRVRTSSTKLAHGMCTLPESIKSGSAAPASNADHPCAFSASIATLVARFGFPRGGQQRQDQHDSPSVHDAPAFQFELCAAVRPADRRRQGVIVSAASAIISPRTSSGIATSSHFPEVS